MSIFKIKEEKGINCCYNLVFNVIQVSLQLFQNSETRKETMLEIGDRKSGKNLKYFLTFPPNFFLTNKLADFMDERKGRKEKLFFQIFLQ